MDNTRIHKLYVSEGRPEEKKKDIIALIKRELNECSMFGLMATPYCEYFFKALVDEGYTKEEITEEFQNANDKPDRKS